MTNEAENFLAHAGVLGMKWGVHKRSTVGGPNLSLKLQKKVLEKAGAARAKAIAKRAPEHIDLTKTKKSPAKNLSNAEIQKAITRMNLEKQYSSLNPKGISKGQKQVAAVLALGATVNAAIIFANSPAGKAVIDGINKAGLKVARTVSG